MQTGPEGAAIVRPAAQQHEPRILPARQCRHGRDGTRGLKDARSGQDHRAGSSVVQRCPQVCKSGAVFSAPEAFGQLAIYYIDAGTPWLVARLRGRVVSWAGRLASATR